MLHEFKTRIPYPLALFRYNLSSCSSKLSRFAEVCTEIIVRAKQTTLPEVYSKNEVTKVDKKVHNSRF